MAMFVDATRIISAMRVPPSDAVYFVVCPVEGLGLRIGDPVIMREVNLDNVLVRTTDMTVHPLNHDGEYLMLAPAGAVQER